MPVPRPKLRSVEAIIVPDGASGRVLLLRDTEGIAERPVVVPIHLAAVVSQFDGAHTVEEVAREVSAATGRAVDVAIVEQLAAELDGAWMLDTPRFRARRIECMREFERAPVRRAWHAGGAYHGEAPDLRRYIDEECLSKVAPTRRADRIVGLCAPHMDLWRAAVGYGHAYSAFADAIGDETDTFILLGTCHAPMRRPFAVCDKAFDTPLGRLEPDREAIAELSQHARFDVREDEYLHRSEHSLEFQAVFLKYVLGDRPARIVPVLCGLGDAQASGRDPALDGDAESFVQALGSLVERNNGRAAVIAGADLAHIGPRFGDPRPLDDDERARLRRRDLDSIGLAADRDERAFFHHVVEDLTTRRVCGLGPIYTMLRVLPAAVRGELLHYAQCVDPDEGSIVSYASMAFSG